MAKTKTKAFGYLRVSGLGQVEGDGFPRQREAIDRYAKAHKLELVRYFQDEGVSGVLELEGREALTELFAALDADGVRLVLVEKADRLARHLITSEMLLREFRKRGVRVIAADSGQELTCDDDTDPTKALIRQVLAAVSQYEKAALVIKLRAARQRIRQAKGRCEGDKPYGTPPAARTPEQAAQAAAQAGRERAVIDRIQALRAERKSLAAIAATLNAEGVPTRRGKRWAAMTVKNVLDRAKRGEQ